MALTVTTDLTVISNAETLTGWSNFGSGGTGTEALETDFFIQGASCISRGVTGVVNKGMCFDIGAGGTLNFTTTHVGKLLYVWMRCNVAQLIDTRANGGMRIVIGSGATAPGDAAGVWSAWYVDGSDTIAGSDGWKCYVIDPTLPPSTTFGGGVDLTAARWFGGVMRTTSTAKGQNFGVDQISYGLGELRCRGANTTAGAGFKEMSDADFGTIANRYGIMIEKEGVFLVQGKLVLGDSVSTNSADFTSQNETLIWERKTYYDGTREMPCVKEINPNTGLPYLGVDLRGNGTGNTNVTFGAKVGSGDTASGRSGSTFIGSRNKTAFTFDDGAVEATLIYGSTFRRVRGGLDMSSNASSDEFIGNIVQSCGALKPGPVKARGCIFTENNGSASKLFEDFKNGAASAVQLSSGGTLKVWLDVLNGSNLSLPVKVEYVEVAPAAASTRREVSQVQAFDAASLTVTVAAAGGTYTRSAGSYITDGFRVGQTVTWSGFTNAGNNATKVILVLTATVMTTSTSGLVNETGNGDERVIDSAGVGSDDHYAECILRFPGSGTNRAILGPTIRGAAGTTENYYFLKCDYGAAQISLVRCDAGTDTTIAGPTSFTFADDTDHLVQITGRGTTIEGFVNGTKLQATSQSSYQTNRRIGLRATANTSQTGTAPRVSRLGAGPLTDAMGAVALVQASSDVGYSSFINNARATDTTTTGTYAYSNDNFSGNLVDLRNDSNGSVTANVTGTGGSPSIVENPQSASTTINNAVTLTITVKDALGVAIQNARVAVYKSSDNTELLNALTNASGVATTTFAFASDTPIYVRVRKTSTGTTRYINNDSSGTITSAGFTATVTLITDTVAAA